MSFDLGNRGGAAGTNEAPQRVATEVHVRPDARRFGWIGAVLLLLIIPFKAARWFDGMAWGSAVIGIMPSVLGPSGLYFLLLSGGGRLARLTVKQTAVGTAVLSLALEFAQLLPRPGILSAVQYTFDWLDVAATLVSVAVSYALALVLSRPTLPPAGSAPALPGTPVRPPATNRTTRRT